MNVAIHPLRPAKSTFFALLDVNALVVIIGAIEMLNSQPSIDPSLTSDFADKQCNDQRSFPRIHLSSVPAELVLADRKRLSVAVNDVSPDGVQIQCDDDTGNQINSTGKDDEHTVFLRFAIPIRNGVTDLLTKCRVSSFSSRPDNGATLSLSFLNFVGTGECDLGRFFVQEMEF